jgi:hypothetical protein
MTALAVALSYIARGWNPVPIPHRSKAPVHGDWQQRIINTQSAPQFFNGGPKNVGVIMGATSHGLTDVDLDCAEAITIAPFILPKTSAIFGRPSKRASHWLYTTNLALTAERAAVRYRDPKTKETIIELRTGGDRGAQTVFPGSTHEGGEAITWDEEGNPKTVDGEDLRQRVRTVAACSLLARYWPGKGSRHDAALAIGGFLARSGRTPITIKITTEAIARAAHDEEWRDRRTAAKDAADAYYAGKHAYGFNGLREIFGQEVADKVAEWFDYGSGNEQGFDIDEAPTAPAQEAEQHAKEPIKPLIHSSSQFTKDFISPDYLIDGLLQRRFFYLLTARTGAGKTSLALLFAACVALGVPVGPLQTDKGRVLFFAGENPDDIRARWIAMSQQMDFDIDTIDVYFIPGTFKISQLIKRIHAEVDALGGVEFLIVDTSAAYFETDNENDAIQMLHHAHRLRDLVKLPGGPCVLANCHPIKNATDDNLVPRGGGSFLNESDGNLTARNDNMTVELHWQGKFRGPDFAPMNFMLKSVTHERLKDTKGRLIPTVVASHLSDIAHQELAGIARLDEDLMLQALSKNATASFADLAKDLNWYTAKGEPSKSKVQRTLVRLKRDGLVKQERGRFMLTDKGKKAI